MNKKNTVLIVGPTPPPMGGIATYVKDMLNSSIYNEYKVLHLNTARTHSTKRSYIKNFIFFSKNIFKLVNYLIRNKPQIVHIHTSSYLAFWEKSAFVIISKFYGKKVVLHMHGAEFNKFYESSNIIYKYGIRGVLTLSDRVIVLSMCWKEFFLQILNEKKISVIPNGIDYSRLNLFENQKKDDIPTKTKIVFLGNLVERKGIYDILHSIPIVIDRFKEVQFIFAGSEENEGDIDKFKEMAIVKQFKERIQIKINISEDDKMRILSESDIYLLPSYAEGLPISLLEAMAVGLPIISTPVGGIPEVIVEGENGYLISPGDYIELANKIMELIENPQLKKKIGVNNRDKVNQVYNWNNISSKIVGEYNRLVG